MAADEYIKWENLNFLWKNIDMTWEEIKIVSEVRRGGSSTYYGDYEKNNPWKKVQEVLVDESKTEKFIKILCRVNDLDYETIIKPNNNIKITAQHFEKTFDESIKESIKIKVEV